MSLYLSPNGRIVRNPYNNKIMSCPDFFLASGECPANCSVCPDCFVRKTHTFIFSSITTQPLGLRCFWTNSGCTGNPDPIGWDITDITPPVVLNVSGITCSMLQGGSGGTWAYRPVALVTSGATRYCVEKSGAGAAESGYFALFLSDLAIAKSSTNTNLSGYVSWDFVLAAYKYDGTPLDTGKYRTGCLFQHNAFSLSIPDACLFYSGYPSLDNQTSCNSGVFSPLGNSIRACELGNNGNTAASPPCYERRFGWGGTVTVS